MMYGSNSKTLQHADSSKAILYPASEEFSSLGGKLTDGYSLWTNSKTQSMSVHNELNPKQIAEAARELMMAKQKQSRFNFARSVVHHSTGEKGEEDDEIVVPKPI